MRHFIYILLFGLVLSTCSNPNEHDQSQKNRKTDKELVQERMADANKYVTSNEETLIASYIERRHWQMQKLDGGLRVWEYEKGKGAGIGDESTVKLNYTLELINGQEVYSSKNNGVKVFQMGNNEVEKGLEEAVALLHVGSKAKVIIPSHLGYGLRGDGNSIPKKATLIYDIEVLP